MGMLDGRTCKLKESCALRALIDLVRHSGRTLLKENNHTGASSAKRRRHKDKAGNRATACIRSMKIDLTLMQISCALVAAALAQHSGVLPRFSATALGAGALRCGDGTPCYLQDTCIVSFPSLLARLAAANRRTVRHE